MKRAAPIFSMGFVFFTLLWLGASHLLLPVFAGQQDYSLMISDPDWTLVSIAGILAVVIGMFAIFGVFSFLQEKGGKIAFAGFCVLMLGLMTELITLSWDLFIWPVLIQQPGMMAFIRDGIFIKTMQFQVVIYTLMVSLLIGSVLLAISIWKTNIFPVWTAISLVAGILLYIAGNMLSIVIASIGLVLYCAGFFGIGLRQMSMNRHK